MKLLIIGGTVFVGRHLVEAALARGHQVTLFNRGQHNPEIFPEAEKIRGDRDGDLSELDGRTWDAVVDTCGYVPRIVQKSAQKLAGAAGHYTFISSISVYADFRRPLVDENSPVGTTDNETAETITNENYGPLKVLCERIVEQTFPKGALIIRPGMIVGPNDPSDRFTYWPARVARGGDVLVPGTPEQGFELIDVRDLAEWNLALIEARKTGVYNAAGPDYPLTMKTVLETCREVSGSDARFVYVPADWLRRGDFDPNSIHAWYIDEGEEAFRYVWDVNCEKARADGLTYRPLAETVRDTLDWDATRPADLKRRLSLEPARESELLRAWQNGEELPVEAKAEAETTAA